MASVEIVGLRAELVPHGEEIVHGLDLTIGSGEIVAVVGESGSGKTTVGNSLLAYSRRGATISAGQVKISGTDILGLASNELREMRGNVVAYVPQDPAASLNPALKIGRQLREVLDAHGVGASDADRQRRIRDVLDEVNLSSDASFLARLPHEISGGQQQRVAIAMAFLCRPKVIVFDEPTTGLDVVTQSRVLETVRRLCRTHGVSALYVTHDLAVVANLADRVLVLYAGVVAELVPTELLLTEPKHPYTRMLLRAVPDPEDREEPAAIPGYAPQPGQRPPGCVFASRCPLRIERCDIERPPLALVAQHHLAACHRVDVAVAAEQTTAGVPPRRPRHGDPVLTADHVDAFYGSHQVVFDAGLELSRGECVALVGESGSGKTTLSRALIGLAERTRGDMRLGGESLPAKARDRSTEARRRMQYIFQSSSNALNPRRTVAEAIEMSVTQFFPGKRSELRQRVFNALDRVALPGRVASLYPAELSGGEKQRVAIARALACEPDILICDEVTSALDVSVQAVIVKLLQDLQWEYGVAILFLTHNLALVRAIADRVMVMYEGRIVETAQTEALLSQPQSAYAAELLAKTPSIRRAAAARGPHFG